MTGQRSGHAELPAATALLVMNILSPACLICSHLLLSPLFLLLHSFSIIPEIISKLGVGVSKKKKKGPTKKGEKNPKAHYRTTI